MSSSAKLKVLLEGTLHKKGQINMSWKQRYFVFYDNGIILFYDNYTESKSKNAKKKATELSLLQVKSFVVLTKGETNKKSDREYSFQLITTQRSYTLAAQHAKQFHKFTGFVEKFVYGKVMKKGYLHKLGEKRKSWKKRYFILYDSKKLMYFENEKDLSAAKGVIALSEVNGFGYGQEHQYKSKLVIELKTKQRVWALRAANEQEVTSWFDHILKTMNASNKDEARTANAAKASSKLNNSSTDMSKSPHLLIQSEGTNINSIDFNLSDNDELAELPEDGKLLFFQFTADKKPADDAKEKAVNNEHANGNVDDDHKGHQQQSSTTNALHLDAMMTDQKGLENMDENAADIGEYRRMQIKLAKQWKKIMKDVVIDKEHTLQMDASSHFCAESLKRKEAKQRDNATPASPDTSFIASIPKMTSNDLLLNLGGTDDDDIELPGDFMMEIDDEMTPPPELEFAENIMSPKTQKKMDKEHQMKLFEHCQCVQRIRILCTTHLSWMQYKASDAHKNEDEEGICGLISVLSDYNLTDLLNDYYHIKRYHVESTKVSASADSDESGAMNQVTKTAMLDPSICNYLNQQMKCNVKHCVCMRRNMNERSLDHKQRRVDYLMNSDTEISSSGQTLEIVTQQILDMIHSYVFHLSYCIRNVLHKERHKFVTVNDAISHGQGKQNVAVLEEEEEIVQDDTKKQEEEEDIPDAAPAMNRMYSNFDAHFGKEIEYKNVKKSGVDKPKYFDLKQEILNCEHALSEQEWIETMYKAGLLLKTFESNALQCKKDIVLEAFQTETQQTETRVIKTNEFITADYILTLLVYCNFDEVRDELIMSYRSMDDNTNYYKFYHFGSNLHVLVSGFGCNIYDSNVSNAYVSPMQSTLFYHSFKFPVLFQSLTCDFHGGPTSMTIIPSIVFTNMYNDAFKQGIIVEMDMLSSPLTNYFDVSLYSNFAYESERLFYGKVSLSITNIIESDITSSGPTQTKFHYHSQYLHAITLLRMIIGDCNMQKTFYENEIVCERLTLLISLEINYRRVSKLMHNKKSANSKAKQINEKGIIPEYIGKLFHLWCMNTKGVIVLHVDNVRKLKQNRLQSYFISMPRAPIKSKESADSNSNSNKITLAFRVLYQLFPNVTKILAYGFVSDLEYICSSFCDFVTGRASAQIATDSKVNECIFQLNDLQFESPESEKFKEITQLVTKYQTALKEKQSSWTIKAKIPQSADSLDIPKLSFVKNGAHIDDDDKQDEQ